MTDTRSNYVFTSESVTEGHPDKICDQISDAILDAILAKEIDLAKEGYIAPSGQPADPTQLRCACETLVTTGLVVVAGEIRTQALTNRGRPSTAQTSSPIRTKASARETRA